MSDTSSKSLTAATADQLIVLGESSWNEASALLVNQDLIVVPPKFIDQGALKPEDLSVDERRTRKRTALALIQHWASLSFVLSKDDALRMCDLSPAACRWLHTHVTPALRERLGAHVSHAPMYPNFPKSVMIADEADLLYNALLHYTGAMVDVRVLPQTTALPRASTPLKDRKTRPLSLVLGNELRTHLDHWTRSATTWTPALSSVMTLFFPLLQAYGLLGSQDGVEAPKWPNRENQAKVAAEWLRDQVGKPLATKAARRLAASRALELDLPSHQLALAPSWPFGDPTSTDVLRAVVVFSGGTADLARDRRPSTNAKSTRVKMAKLSRPQRRALMSAIDQVAGSKTGLEDMHKYRPQWRVLAERLHAGEWVSRFPRAVELVDKLRNAPAPETWDAKVDHLLSAAPSKASVKSLVILADERPGAIVRAAHRILSWSESIKPAKAASSWSLDVQMLLIAAAAETETGVVLAAWGTLRQSSPQQRLMLPKGRVDKRYLVDPAPAIANDSARHVVAGGFRQTLLNRFAEMGPMGDVYVAPGLHGILLPQGLRDASDTGAGIVARGSRLPLDLDPSGRDQIIRLFLWWHDTADGRVDVDLSAVGVSKTFGSTETCNFQKLRGSGLVHSGDLTSAPNGAAEFVDIDLNNLHKDTRYVVLTANVFSGPNFDQIPDCFVGWMERTKAQAGPIHDIRTVSNKIAVTARSKAFLGVVFDCVDRTLTWLDVPLDTNSGHSFYDAPSAACEVVREFKLYAAARVSVGELIDLHIEARGGNKLMEPTGAQTYFAVNPVVPAAGQTVVAATRPDQVMALLPSRRGASPAPAVEADPVSPQNLPSPSSDGLGVSLKDSVAEEVAVKTATEAARPGRKPR